jgi:protein tyrosine phosphatase (PTP) superfamily phosphohydrolase (DUF442 family)
VVVLVAVLVVGNLTIVGLSMLARSTTPSHELGIAGVRNGVAVDDHVWRGAAPTAAGYRSLAAAGVTTVVDLRSDSERGAAVDVLDELGVESVRLPIRDGQLPTNEEIGRFLEVVADSDGTVFVHCGAGVGRTGAMAAAYLTAVGEAGGTEAVRRNLAVGPPSLEQIAFAARGNHPGPVVTALSRVLDAPRRIWHNLT